MSPEDLVKRWRREGAKLEDWANGRANGLQPALVRREGRTMRRLALELDYALRSPSYEQRYIGLLEAEIRTFLSDLSKDDQADEWLAEVQAEARQTVGEVETPSPEPPADVCVCVHGVEFGEPCRYCPSRYARKEPAAPLRPVPEETQ